MIFFSIVELLDGIRLFITNEDRKEFNYVAVDSSFQFFLIKKEFDILKIENTKKETIEEIKQSEIINHLWKEINNFVDNNYQFLDKKEIIHDDLIDALKSFTKEFNLEISCLSDQK